MSYQYLNKLLTIVLLLKYNSEVLFLIEQTAKQHIINTIICNNSKSLILTL